MARIGKNYSCIHAWSAVTQGGTKQSFIRGGQAPRSNPLPRFRTEKVVSLVYRLLTNGTPFTYLEIYIPFNCSKCTVSLSVNRRTHTQIHAPTVVEGGEVDGTPPYNFWCVAVFRNDFAFSGKTLIVSTRWGMFYGWWRCWRPVTSLTMVAILAAILDFTKN